MLNRRRAILKKQALSNSATTLKYCLLTKTKTNDPKVY